MKKFLALSSIVVLSILWMALAYYWLLERDFLTFDFTKGFMHNFWPILIKMGVLLGFFLITISAKRIFPYIFTDYSYHFYFWLLLMLLFTLVNIYNRGWYWFSIGCLLGLPALGLNYINLMLQPKKFVFHKKVSAAILVIVFIVGGYSEYFATEIIRFNNEDYKVKVSLYTIPTFMDWQVEGKIKIKDKRTKKKGKFRFWFGNGPYFEVCKDINSINLIYLKGTEYNRGDDWVINLNKKSIEEEYFPDGLKNIEVIFSRDVKNK